MQRVLIYNAQGDTKLYSLQRVMQELILLSTGIPVEIVTAETVAGRVGPEALLILPGARASTGYRTQIGGARFEAVMTAMDKGMQVLGICAGAYVLCKEFSYDDYDPVTGRLNETRHVSSGLGIVNARAWGPDQRLYTAQPRVEGDPWTVYQAVSMQFNVSGQVRQANVAISKAPSFYDLHPAQCQPLAHYTATGDVAMLAFKFGQGGGVLSGPVFEVGGDNLKHYVHPRHAEDPRAQAIIQKLFESRNDWHELLGSVFGRLLPDAAPQIRRNLGLGRAGPL